VDALKEAANPGKVEKPKPQKGLGDEGLNIFRPDGGKSEAPVDPSGTSGTSGTTAGREEGGTVPPPLQWNPPEYALVRFVDWEIKPGKVYAYRVRIRMANPNYKRTDVAGQKLALEAELKSPWIDIPEAVVVPPERAYYVEAKSPRDQVTLQVHRWLVDVRPDPNHTTLQHPVGDWVVAEKVPVNRGEFLFRKHKADVPYWAFDLDRFILAANPSEKDSKKKEEGVLVELSTGDNEPLLVDFEPALQSYTRKLPPAADSDKPRFQNVTDNAAVEVLILSPDGKLLARDSTTDAQDKEREERYKTWQARVKEAKANKPEDKPKNPFEKKPDGGSRGGGAN
jgi:hypothetical protein